MRPPGGPTVPAPVEKPPPAPWDRWSEVASFRVAIARGPSQHFAGDHEAEVLASKEAEAYPDLGPAKLLGPGSALVERLYFPGEATPAVVFAMVKAPAAGGEGSAPATRGSTPAATAATTQTEPATTAASAAWEFLVIAPDGKVEERGAIETCARCHAEAPHDGVFGRAL